MRRILAARHGPTQKFRVGSSGAAWACDAFGLEAMVLFYPWKSAADESAFDVCIFSWDMKTAVN